MVKILGWELHVSRSLHMENGTKKLRFGRLWEDNRKSNPYTTKFEKKSPRVKFQQIKKKNHHFAHELCSFVGMFLEAGLFTYLLSERLAAKINHRKGMLGMGKDGEIRETLREKLDYCTKEMGRLNFCWHCTASVALLVLIAAASIAWNRFQQLHREKQDLQVSLGRYEATVQVKNERIQQLESEALLRQRDSFRSVGAQSIGQTATPFVLAFPGRI